MCEPHRDRARVASVSTRAIGAAIVLLVAAIVVVDGGTSTAATAPAELMTILPPVEAGSSSSSSISLDGGLVGFDHRRFSEPELVRVRNRFTAQTEAITPDNFYRYDMVMSRDGCHVAHLGRFTLNDGLDYSGESVVVTDRCTGSPELQIFSQSRAQSAGRFSDLVISAHGRYVALRDSSTNTIVRLDRDTNGNGVVDDSVLGVVSTGFVAFTASLGDESLTPLVAISALAPRDTVAQVYLWDPTRAAGDPAALTLVSANDGTTTPLTGVASFTPSMTPDGRYVAFVSSTAAFVGGAGSVAATDHILVRDTATNRTVVVSRNAAGVRGNGRSISPSISADGTQIAFGTTATDLMTPGIGGIYSTVPATFATSLDLVVARSTTGFYGSIAFDRVSLKPNGDPVDPKMAGMFMGQPAISSNGRWVSFTSAFNAELQTGATSTTATDRTTKVYVIGRPTSVGITPLDFGAVQIGAPSGVQSVNVTNSGISSFLPAAITTTGTEFSVVPGGSCASNVWLSPGQSCTVAVRFTPVAVGVRTSTITVAENGFGFQAMSASGPLTGTGTAVPVVTTTTVTTTATTVPPTVTTTTAPRTTTTTVPRQAALTISPSPASFGTSVVGGTSQVLEFVVTSNGNRSAPITDVSLSGPNNADFAIVTNDCAGANLPPGGSCGVFVTFTPSDVGVRTAVLSAGSPVGTATSNLDGTGNNQPNLRLLPNVVALGAVTTAVGAGFPPNQPVQLQWALDTTRTFTGTADAAGNFAIQVPVRLDEQTGPRTMNAVDQPGAYSGVTTPCLVVDTSMQPSAGQNPALPNFPSLIVRG